MEKSKIYLNIIKLYQKFRAWLLTLKGWKKALAFILLFGFLPLWPLYFGLVAYWLIKKFVKSDKVLHLARVALVLYIIIIAIPFGTAVAVGMANPAPVEVAVEKQENKPVETQKEVEKPTVKLYEVVKVVDGDTVDVNIDGKTERIRLIGLDTPETVDPRKTVQCFGQEASTKAHELLDGKKVTLEADATQGERDTYDRLLRYIFVEGNTDFSKTMIENGYGHEYTYQIPYKRQNEYKDAQKSAENGKKGLWADTTCAGGTTAVTPAPAATTPTPAAPKATTPAVTAPAQTNTGCVIKGNISSSKEKIYHVPGGGSYEKTVIDTSAGERWFCSEADALAAGWRKALN